MSTLTTTATGKSTNFNIDLPTLDSFRSPLASPSMRGAVVGLTLETELAALYLATVQSLCYGTRHIIDTITEVGHSVNSLTVCGGITNSSLFLQTQADVLNMNILVPREKESVLLGAAMLGMSAAGQSGDLHQVVTNINIRADVVEPRSSKVSFHEAKYKVFREMVRDQLKYRDIMEKYDKS